MKMFEILPESPKCEADTIGKMVPISLLNAGLPQAFDLLKKKKKAIYLQSAIKPGRPFFGGG